MGKDPFEDSELQALRASMRPTASPVRWGRVLTSVLVVACATFAVAYYLPLRRAHEALGAHFADLKSKVDSANRAAAESRARAKELSDKTQALQSELDATLQAGKTAADASRASKSALESKLQKQLTAEQAAVGTTGSQTVASLSLPFLLTRGKLEVSPPGKLALCAVASTAGTSTLRVVALAGKKDIPPSLAAKLKTPLELNLAVAELVTRTLLDQCKAAPTKLLAAGAPAEPPATALLDGKKLSGSRLELWLENGP